MNKKIFKTELLTQQVKDYIAKNIAAGKYSKAKRLPPEQDLAEELGVSRLTLRNALASLEKDGWIMRRRGKGTLINPSVVTLKGRLDYEVELTQMIKNHGYKVTIEGIEVFKGKPSSHEEKMLNLNEGDEVVTIKKLWWADNIPAIYTTDIIPFTLFKVDINPKFGKETIFKVLENSCDEKVDYNVTRLWPEKSCNIDENIKKSLKLEKGAPILVIEEVGFNFYNKPILFSQEIYRSGIFEFSLVRTST